MQWPTILDLDKWPPIIVKALAASALVFGSYRIIDLAASIWPYVRPSSLARYNRAPKGNWALVTGASDGIGKAFAEELLCQGFNVVLHGRNLRKLDALKRDLRKEHESRKVEVLVADASAAEVDYDAIVRQVESLPGKLTVLVNNVGGVTTRPSYAPLDRMGREAIDVSINVNARFAMHLTSRLLPQLKANGPSLILNTGSLAGLTGMPYLVPYASTKGFINLFSKSLKAELGSVPDGRDVEVLGLLIGNVKSAGNTQDDAPISTITAQQCAQGSLARVGCGSSLVWCHWRHALLNVLMGSLPERSFRRITGEMLRKRMEEEESEALKTE